MMNNTLMRMVGVLDHVSKYLPELTNPQRKPTEHDVYECYYVRTLNERIIQRIEASDEKDIYPLYTYRENQKLFEQVCDAQLAVFQRAPDAVTDVDTSRIKLYAEMHKFEGSTRPFSTISASSGEYVDIVQREHIHELPNRMFSFLRAAMPLYCYTLIGYLMIFLGNSKSVHSFVELANKAANMFIQFATNTEPNNVNSGKRTVGLVNEWAARADTITFPEEVESILSALLVLGGNVTVVWFTFLITIGVIIVGVPSLANLITDLCGVIKIPSLNMVLDMTLCEDQPRTSKEVQTLLPKVGFARRVFTKIGARGCEFQRPIYHWNQMFKQPLTDETFQAIAGIEVDADIFNLEQII